MLGRGGPAPNEDSTGAEFAEKIVRPNASDIEFGGFSPLLDRVVEAMKHHYEK